MRTLSKLNLSYINRLKILPKPRQQLHVTITTNTYILNGDCPTEEQRPQPRQKAQIRLPKKQRQYLIPGFNAQYDGALIKSMNLA